MDSIGYSKDASVYAKAYKEASHGLDLVEGLDLQEAISFLCTYQKALAHFIIGRAKKINC